jgi:hypothetical protein
MYACKKICAELIKKYFPLVLKNIFPNALKKVEKYLDLAHIVFHRRSFDDQGPLVDIRVWYRRKRSFVGWYGFT